MTDLDTASTTRIDDVKTDAVGSDAPVEWAPAAEPRRRRGRAIALWVGIPVGALLIGAGIASAFLIAPGTRVAGVDVGLLTPGAASERIAKHVENATYTVAGQDLTAAALGVTVDAKQAAVAAHEARPAWNVTQWFGGTGLDASIHVDQATAEAALTDALPGRYTAATDATVVYDATNHTFTTTPAANGTGIDLADANTQIQQGLLAGGAVTVTPKETAALPLVSDEKAAAGASAANALLQDAGFYVGNERVVPIEPDTLAGWITFGHDSDGNVTVTPDRTKVQAAIDALPGQVNRAPQNGVELVNAAGKVLGAATPSVDGLTLGDTSGLADQVVSGLQTGNAHFATPANVQKATTTQVTRLLEVNLTEQRLYLKENGVTVDSWLISSGKDATPTYQGRFTVNAHVRSQTMTSTSETDPTWNYSVPNVQWVMYYNGDQAFHGVYWHTNWGKQMSHGCVGMSNAKAQSIYDWALNGTDVWIHA